METIIGEPSDTGLSAALDAFYGAWSDFAARPSASGVQGAVQESGAKVAQQLNRSAQRLDELQVERRVSASSPAVDEVNEIATAIADLNQEIVAAESVASANTLRDQRDLKLDRLVQLTGAEVLESSDGSVGVLLNGLSLVDGSQVRPLTTSTVNGITEVTRESLPTRPVQIGGELGALRQLSVIDIPALTAKLDTLTRGIVDGVNAIHRAGADLVGDPRVATPAGDFFASDPMATSDRSVAHGARHSARQRHRRVVQRHRRLRRDGHGPWRRQCRARHLGPPHGDHRLRQFGPARHRVGRDLPPAHRHRHRLLDAQRDRSRRGR